MRRWRLAHRVVLPQVAGVQSAPERRPPARQATRGQSSAAALRYGWLLALGAALACGDGPALGGGATGATETDGAGDSNDSPDGDGDSPDGTADGGDNGDDNDGGGDAGGCPEPAADPPEYVDMLEHLGRAQGDTFIEILDVEADGNLVHACTATQGLTIWDATNEQQPALIVENIGPAGLAHPQFPRCQHLGYDAAAQQMVLTNRGDEIQPDPWLYLYDVSDPAAPQPLRGLQTSESIEGVVLEDGRIWAAAHKSGILVLDDTGGDDLVMTASWSDADSDAWAGVKVGSTLLTAEGTTGIRSYDISGDEPVLLDTLALPGSSKDLVVVDDTAYVAASSFLAAVDVSDPSTMTLLLEREVRGTALALDMAQDGIVMVAEWDEIRGYDTTDPELPEVLSETVPRDGASFSRVLSLDAEPNAGRVYAGEWRGMHAYDQHDGPTGPEVLATPGSLQYGRVEVGDFEDKVLVVRNAGPETLEIYGVDSDLEGVSASPSCATVPAGGAAALEIRFEPESESSHRGRVVLQTNDVDEPLFEVSMSGNIAGLDIGDPAPEFSLTDLDGAVWNSADQLGKVVVLSYFATF